jgi:imidazolonepropionase-like amidohydrolase
MELKEKFVLVGGTLIDGTGSNIKKDAVVVVKDGVIDQVGTKETVNLTNDIQKVDVTGKYILPGLIDSHVHILGSVSDYNSDWMLSPNYVEAVRATVEAQRCLDWGFTTLRDCGSRYSLDLSPKN